MGGAIRFDGPTGQQQSQNDTENQLFLFRQAVHANNITETGQTATIPFTIYDLRFTIEQTPFDGQIINQNVNHKLPWQPLADFKRAARYFHAKVVDGELFRLRGDVFGSPSFDRRPTARNGVKTLVPVVPSKVIAVGLNYIEHARETGKPLPRLPLFWLKAATSLLPDGGKIEVPFPHHRTDYEAELAIVIGRKIRNVTPATASRYIFGYTASQDISDRTIQNAESQWTRCKSFDTFTPLGPFVETKLDPNELTIQLFQNGHLRQNSNTSQLIFKPGRTG